MLEPRRLTTLCGPPWPITAISLTSLLVAPDDSKLRPKYVGLLDYIILKNWIHITVILLLALKIIQFDGLKIFFSILLLLKKRIV
jgi:hypothetical protein